MEPYRTTCPVCGQENLDPNRATLNEAVPETPLWQKKGFWITLAVIGGLAFLGYIKEQEEQAGAVGQGPVDGASSGTLTISDWQNDGAEYLRICVFTSAHGEVIGTHCWDAPGHSSAGWRNEEVRCRSDMTHFGVVITTVDDQALNDKTVELSVCPGSGLKVVVTNSYRILITVA